MANSTSKKYYIFGAHSRAQTLHIYLKSLFPDWELVAFLYDNDEKNPEKIDGIPVYKIEGNFMSGVDGVLVEFDPNADAYVGTRGVFFEHAKSVLSNMGFEHVFFYNQKLDNELRNIFIPEYYKKQGWGFRKIEDPVRKDYTVQMQKGRQKYHHSEVVCNWTDQCKVFVVKSVFDAELEVPGELKNYENYIQAGKALTDTVLDNCRVFDDFGENISDKNRQMCELTAMYWIWKNSGEDIVGLEHYRRRFILPDDWRQVLGSGDADVILPVPLYVHPSIKENYVSRHEKWPWEVMMQELQRQYGNECFEEADNFFSGTGCYCPCNMIIAKKAVFYEVCAFVFPIIFAVMEKCGVIEDKYQNRYPGFLSERLISFFFNHNREKYKVVFADKVFLS